MLLAALLACGPVKVAVPETGDPPSTDDSHSTVETAESGDDSADLPDVRPENASCFAPDPPATGYDVAFEEAYPNLDFTHAVQALQRPGDGSRWYVVEQDGEIWTWDAADVEVSDPELFLDISDRADDSYTESGLLGMAFHPDFAENGQYFLSYTATGSGGSPFTSRISRFTSPDSETVGDEDSEEILLSIAQPYQNHDGGALLWGPDDYLYASYGDGGSAGDPQENAQDTTVLLGKILRIDPDGGSPYAIPADNPFADGADGAPEIYAWGLRNVWRMSFDRETGELWAGDVGQDRWEEVDRIDLGGNYGWDDKEASHCYEATSPCEGGGLIDPVVEYGHSIGKSVVGGYVYRGSAIPGLVGTYLFSDFYVTEVWGLVWEDDGSASYETVARTGATEASFAEDADGEVYVMDYNGTLRELVPTADSAPSDFPDLLSETGCFDGPSPGGALIPYDVISPLWSDGAEKARYFAIPDDTTIDVEADGDLTFPPRSVLVKTFRFDDAPVETRLFVRQEDGDWAGYTYQWDEDGADATLVVGGGAVDLATHTWALPSSNQCLECHSEAAGRSLGLELAQLEQGAQVDRLEEMGLFSSALPEITPLSDPTGDDDLDVRARSYLHANCSGCHRPDGPGRGDLDLRATAEDMGVCDETPEEGDLGITDAVVLAPGEPDRSVLLERMERLDAYRMPPLGSSVVDEDGTALIEAWISGMTDCP